MPVDWYRNTTWSPSIARDFQARLSRARAANRAQYLLIQAGSLAQSHPTVVLDLLSQYFELPMERPSPLAHVIRARTLVLLGRLEDAIASYEAALAREHEFSNDLTQAYLELPSLIAEHHLRARYDRAIDVLRDHRDRPTFPIEHFRWNAVNALLVAERAASDSADAARTFAQRALEAAEARHSGFRHHPSLGLVGEESADLIRRLRVLAGA